jgi:hypothetical protein
MKSQSLELLNGVKDLLVQFASENNINLRDEFETVDEFKKFTIALTFKQLVALGVEVKDAYDMVLGAGQYDELVEKVWNAAQ